MKTDLGNRHHGNFDGKLLRANDNARVRIMAGEGFASTQGGQHLLWMLVNLVARQYGVVSAMEIAVPGVGLHDSTALFGKAANLQSTLIETAKQIASGQMDVLPVPPTSRQNFTSIECIDIPNSRWSATAEGWNLHVAPGDEVPETLPKSALSIGPYFAACILAGEIFKSIRGYDPSRRRTTPVIMSLWSFGTSDNAAMLPKASEELRAIPFSYLVGAGAVGQAVAATLIASGLSPKQTISIDGDAIDQELTNLNRYCLSVESDRGRNKAEIISSLFEGTGCEMFHFPKHWADYVQSSDYNIPSEIRRAERDGRYEFIISCVDINTSRHDLQRMWPRLIIGGSTFGMSAAVQIYNLGADQECLMCSNPLEIDDWTIEGELARLQQLSQTELEAEALRVGMNPKLLIEHVRKPGCGTLGEAEFRRFQPAASRHDWSIGFVSVGAGVMLAAILLRYFSEPVSADDLHAFRYSFETNRAGKSRHRPNPECDCRQYRKDYWRNLWT